MSEPTHIHCLVVSPCATETAHTRALVADAHALGIHTLAHIEQYALYFLQGALNENDLEKLARELFTDAVTENYHWRGVAEQEGTRGTEGNEGNEGTKGLGDRRYAIRDRQIIQVALRPGVTDPVAHEIVRAAHALGITNLQQAATGQQYLVRGHTGAPLAEKELHQLARRLLANDVIQHYALGEIEPTFPQDAHASGIVETIPLTELSDDELLNLSNARRAALDVNEMRAAQNYFRSIGREPTDVEFEMLAQTWSEHCVHKTFKAKISYQSSVNSNQ